MTAAPTLEDVARRALDGDRDALDRLARALQDDVYTLALRMLWNREDAEDATQEILVRAVTRLARFEFRSRLKTWVYRIAVNYLLDVRRSPVERMKLNFARSGIESPIPRALMYDSLSAQYSKNRSDRSAGGSSDRAWTSSAAKK